MSSGLSAAPQHFSRAQPAYRHPLSLAYLDIDAFKAANDRFGHTVGDRVLIALAGVARATARSVDTVARIGGDGARHARVAAARSTAADGRLLPFAQRSGA